MSYSKKINKIFLSLFVFSFVGVFLNAKKSDGNFGNGYFNSGYPSMGYFDESIGEAALARVGMEQQKIYKQMLSELEERKKLIEGVDDQTRNKYRENQEALSKSEELLSTMDKLIRQESGINDGSENINEEKLTGDWEGRKKLCEKREEIEKEIQRQRSELKEKDYINLEDDDKKELIAKIDRDIKRVTSMQNGKKGDIFLRGMAGEKNWKMVKNIVVGDSMLEGFKAGVMLNTALPLGNAIGKTVERYVKTIFDGGLGKIEELVIYFFRLIFHSSRKPFTIQEIQYWKKLLATDLMEIDRMMKNADKLDSRGKAEVLRDYDDAEEQEIDEQKQKISLWQDFIEDLVATCQDLAQEIQIREGYYKRKQNGFGVTSCTRSLKNKLLKLKNWLEQAKTLKDFANTSEAKSIIPAMKSSINNYFDNLANQIQPVDSRAKNIGMSGISSYPYDDKKDKWSGGMGDYYGDGYPANFMD